jgi:hypothetical protein
MVVEEKKKKYPEMLKGVRMKIRKFGRSKREEKGKWFGVIKGHNFVDVKEVGLYGNRLERDMKRSKRLEFHEIREENNRTQDQLDQEITYERRDKKKHNTTKHNTQQNNT